MMTPQFLVEVEAERFFCGFRVKGFSQPITADVPCQGAHLQYVTADELVGNLRNAGFRSARVTNIFGEPCTAAMLIAHFRAEHERLRAIRELNGLDLLAVLGSMAPEKLAARMGISMPELRNRIVIAQQQVQAARASIAEKSW